MTKALDVFTSEISDETARVNLMHENKSKLPPTPVSEILPRGNYFNENEDHLQRLLPSYMEIILFYEWNFFFYFIGDSLRHTVLSKQLFETESADIKFCNLITYTFSASKVISHSEVDQNITNVSDLRNYCPFFVTSFATRTNQKYYKDEKISP